MGYEIKIYLGNKPSKDILVEDGRYYFRPIVMIDISKPGYDSAIFKMNRHNRAMPVYFYGTDGNTPITADKYDEGLAALPARRVRDALREDCNRDEYRGFQLALDCINSFIRTHKQGGTVAVLYGY